MMDLETNTVFREFKKNHPTGFVVIIKKPLKKSRIHKIDCKSVNTETMRSVSVVHFNSDYKGYPSSEISQMRIDHPKIENHVQCVSPSSTVDTKKISSQAPSS